ncbi:hypothetical protein SAMN05444672_10865 [Bacillus sp. OK838]|nr:hypothetical protein SAMN05444672_10865 [Bacillus sp. OK838]
MVLFPFLGERRQDKTGATATTISLPISVIKFNNIIEFVYKLKVRHLRRTLFIIFQNNLLDKREVLLKSSSLYSKGYLYEVFHSSFGWS